VDISGPTATVIDIGFVLCLVALLVFLVLQFRGSGKGD
jgi:uncharacterized membrane protein YtjA (UPF0391 family)